MQLRSISLFRYDIPLVRYVRLRGEEVAVRSGLIVRAEGPDGTAGYGDIAPLPGFSDETLEDVTSEAVRVARSLTGCSTPPKLTPLTDRFERWLLDHRLSPSVSCGFQAAVMGLEARAAGRTLAAWWDSEAETSVLVNALLDDDDPGTLLAQAVALRDAGYRAVKLKVGRRDPTYEAELVRAVRSVVGEGVALRLDANRAWDLDTALAFGRAVADCGIEYIEEPLRDPTRLVELGARTGVPVALDETAVAFGEEALDRWRGVRAVVLKPTLLGGFEYTMWMARRAMNLGMTPVVSAAFESGVGLAVLAQFAASLRQPEVAVGLDTHRWLADDVTTTPLDMSTGRVWIDQADRVGASVRTDRLQEIPLDA
jgi:o-succinylbenzoate synthase